MSKLIDFAYKSFKLLKVLNLHNLKTLARALRTESASEILLNLKIHLSDGIEREELLSKRELPLFDEYLPYLERNRLTRAQLSDMKNVLDRMPYQPKISIILPVHDVEPRFLSACIESVRDQVYSNWELSIYDDCSKRDDTQVCLKHYRSIDTRIKMNFGRVNQHISGASNTAVSHASGEFVGFLDHDDLLAPEALFEVVKVLNEKPHLSMLYSDQDRLNESGLRSRPYFKSDFNLDLLRSNNYIGHFLVVKKRIGDQLGWFQVGLEGAQDYDLILRIVDHVESSEIYHIPKVLYHWRVLEGSTAKSFNQKPYAFEAGKTALSQHLKRNHIHAEIESGPWGGAYKINYALNETIGKVSIIIPFRDKRRLLKKCVESILAKTTYARYQIVLVNNRSRESETFKYLSSLKHLGDSIKVLNYDVDFNFSRLNNLAVKEITSNYVLFLNNDTEVINQGWLTEMLSLIQRSDVGAVGAKLLYSDGTLQHAGIILGIGGVAGHAFKGKVDKALYYNMGVVKNVSACTGACLLVDSQLFKRVGGFDELNLKIAYNDVDLCLKIRSLGYVITYTPYSVLVHHESKSRGYEDTPSKKARHEAEKRYMQEKWGKELVDPYYHPALTLSREDYSLSQ